MKKITAFILLAFSFFAAQAQTWDTVLRGDPRYLYPDYFPHPDSCIHVRQRMVGHFCLRNFAEEPRTIYGVAMPIGTPVRTEDTLPTTSMAELGYGTVLLDKDKNSNALRLREKNMLTYREVADAFRHRKTLVLGDHCPPTFPISPSDTSIKNVSLLELYFSQPVYVSDTFYAGIPILYDSTTPPDKDTDWSYFQSLGFISLHTIGSDTIRIVCNDVAHPSRWKYIPLIHTYLGCYFPILVSPTEEHPEERITPRSPRLIEIDKGRQYATIEYDLNPEVGDLQLAFAPWPSDPDSAAIITRERHRNNVWTFSNLDTTLTYAVWQRNQCYYRFTCHSDTIIWSDWSEPLIFSLAPPAPDTLWLNDSTYVLGGDTIVIHHEGIPFLSPNPYSLSIYPNPTTGEVAVECGELRVEKIEVLDPQGRVVRSFQKSEARIQQKQNAETWTLDLSSLPKGSYFVRFGNAMKKLILQ